MEQYRIILYWKKIEGYKNCGFKNNRDPWKHGRMNEIQLIQGPINTFTV